MKKGFIVSANLQEFLDDFILATGKRWVNDSGSCSNYEVAEYLVIRVEMLRGTLVDYPQIISGTGDIVIGKVFALLMSAWQLARWDGLRNPFFNARYPSSMEVWSFDDRASMETFVGELEELEADAA